MTVAELLDSPEKWTRKISARDENGDYVEYDSAWAVCWCLDGAIARCYSADQWERAWDAISEAITELYGNERPCETVSFNDHTGTTFADIRRVIERAGV